jgi:lipoyl(octanoyl) transferase
MLRPRLLVSSLGVVPYTHALAVQRRLRQEHLEGRGEDRLLLLQHPPVLTVTRRFGKTHILVPDRVLLERGIEVVEADRGGDVTAHMPGQLVAYPIVRLTHTERNLPQYVRNLEQAVMDTLAAWNLGSLRVRGESGVFMAAVQGHPLEKVCAMGVKGTRFIMSHGLALNVCPDLDVFSLIVPCGLHHRGVTSMRARLGSSCPSVDQVEPVLARALAQSLGRDLVMEVEAPC